MSTTLVFIVIFGINIILSVFMLRENSIEEYGCWNVPDLSEMIMFSAFGIVIFPFWLIRWSLIKIREATW